MDDFRTFLSALLVGFYRGRDLRFANLPDKRPGAWGQGMTAEKIRQCRNLPMQVAQPANVVLKIGNISRTEAIAFGEHNWRAKAGGLQTTFGG